MTQEALLDSANRAGVRSDVFAFNFEKNFDSPGRSQWTRSQWKLSLWISLGYIAVIYLGKMWMAQRKPFNLKGLLVLWNFALALFSIVGTVRTLPELVHIFTTSGVHGIVCNKNFAALDPVTPFWAYVFCMSKAPEMIDTLFILLRKRKLIFLHWYHHVSVFLYCWFSYIEQPSTTRSFIVMNFMVHAIMYTYYGLAAMGKRFPKALSMTITSLQLLQMIVGVSVSAYAVHVRSTGVGECPVSKRNLTASFILYGTYAALFTNFFLKTYIVRAVVSGGRRLSRMIEGTYNPKKFQ